MLSQCSAENYYIHNIYMNTYTLPMQQKTQYNMNSNSTIAAMVGTSTDRLHCT